MKKIIPLLSSFTCAFIILIFWDKIKLPYDENNLIIGNYYYNKINPLNDTIRFLTFLIVPFLVHLLLFIKFNDNILSLNPKSNDYFLIKSEFNNKNILRNYYFFFIIYISLEFLALDFRLFVRPIDFFHEGTYLVPAINYLKNGNLFGSTLYDYGFFANNLALIANYIFGNLSIGGLLFIKLILIYLIKFTLILISKNIILSLEINDFLKKTFFIIFTFIVISLPDYYNPLIFYQRYLLYLIFILFLGSILSINNNKIQLLSIGTFSLISVLWWWDIGAYVNALIFLTLIYFVIHKELKSFIIFLIGALMSWGFFLFLLSPEALKNFFYQSGFIYTASDYLLGIEYGIPFSPDSIRGTKTLIIFYLISIMLIHFNLSKKYKIFFKTKIYLNLLYCAGIIGFKSALMRSDTPHIKYASGILFFLFLFLILMFVFQRFKTSNHIQKILDKYKINLVIFLSLFLFYFLGFYSSHSNINTFKNIFYFKDNISHLVNSVDKNYLNKNFNLVVDRYKKLSENDNCIQILTDDISFPYFLKKPSCTEYFIPGAQVLNKKSEKRFISQLNFSSPEIILYQSPYRLLINPLNMPETLEYIDENYSFYEKFNGYVFYKKN